jgi:hypothetical protein
MENSYQKMKRSMEERHTQTYLIYFDNHNCLSQSEESKWMWTYGKDGTIWEFLKSATWEVAGQEGENWGGDGGKLNEKLSEFYTRGASRGQNELMGKFKTAAGDVISIRGQVMEYTYCPTGIKRELVRFGMDRDQEG